jgi:HK97 family phage prohead protease
MNLKSFELKESAIDMSSRTFEGYASTWDLDSVGDIIHQGAFKKSLTEALPAGKIKVLWQHNEPLGMPIEMSENDHGLYVKAKVSRTRLGDEALELMRDGVVNTLSIGYSIPANKSFFNSDGNREITELKLYEFSPVTFPANEGALIHSVKGTIEQVLLAKSQGLQLKNSAELQQLLTEMLIALSVKNEPLASTQDLSQPLIQIKNDLSEINQFIKQIRGN